MDMNIRQRNYPNCNPERKIIKKTEQSMHELRYNINGLNIGGNVIGISEGEER